MPVTDNKPALGITPIIPNAQSNDGAALLGAPVVAATDTPENLDEQARKLAIQLGEAHGEMIDHECIERRNITVVAIPRRSPYRVMNDRVLLPRIEKIGASVNSKKIIMSDAYMLVKYMTGLVGESASSPTFVKAVSTWLENISVTINNEKEGKTFDLSFRYDNVDVAKEFKAKRAALDAAYEKTPKNTIAARKAALATYLNELMAYERQKAHVGIPLNIEHYVIWLHCLNYPDVAKDSALISISSTVRMFIKDDVKEKRQKDSIQAAKRKALANYLTLTQDKAAYDEMVILVAQHKDINYRKLTALGETDVDAFLLKFANDDPITFNSLYNDPYKKITALVERGINIGHLKRSDVNQRITTADGKDIGSNMTEAIAFYSNPGNILERKQLEARIKNL